MARLLTPRIVCDEGLDKCDNSVLHKVRLTIDGKTRSRLLCAKHAAPHQRLFDKMGGGAVSRSRAKITSMDEIAARKRATPKKA